MQQLELFHDDLAFLQTPGTHFWIDHLICDVESYDPETNEVEFYVRNGAWTGTLRLNKMEITIHADGKIKDVKTISNIKPPSEPSDYEIPY